MKKGFILVDKPSGITSHDVIDRLRKITNIRKIGHSGTLDPFATGLLIIGIGKEFTKQLSIFQKLDKEYVAKIKLGATSSTFDCDGKIIINKIKKIPEIEDIKTIIKKFIGETFQNPPIFSAKKIKGKKAYQLARKGEEVILSPVKINIYKIDILNYSWPYLEIFIACSTGTYIRSLGSDIGESLKTGGYLDSLRRVKISKFDIKNAKKLNEIKIDNRFVAKQDFDEKFLILCENFKK